MDLELGELHSFLILARQLHFRKASEQLFLSQPALSKKIRKLEEKVRGPLFTRTRRKVALTEAGRAPSSIGRRPISTVPDGRTLPPDLLAIARLRAAYVDQPTESAV